MSHVGAMNATSALKEGALKKSGRRIPRQVTRYYVLSRVSRSSPSLSALLTSLQTGELRYYKSAAQKVELGALSDFQRVLPYFNPPNYHGFRITFKSGKISTLFTQTEEETRAWVDALIRFTEDGKEAIEEIKSELSMEAATAEFFPAVDEAQEGADTPTHTPTTDIPAAELPVEVDTATATPDVPQDVTALAHALVSEALEDAMISSCTATRPASSRPLFPASRPSPRSIPPQAHAEASACADTVVEELWADVLATTGPEAVVMEAGPSEQGCQCVIL